MITLAAFVVVADHSLAIAHEYQFQRIEAAELEDKPAAGNVVRLADERKS